jgi:hypothetical protein
MLLLLPTTDVAHRHGELFAKYLYVGATRAATFLGITFQGNIPAEIFILKPLFSESWIE